MGHVWKGRVETVLAGLEAAFIEIGGTPAHASRWLLQGWRLMLPSGFIALLAWTGGWPVTAVAGALGGGIAGTLADSILGATVQARRWCAGCSDTTERLVHSCGRRTEPAGGFQWLDNDGVNFAATLAGAGIAMMAMAMMGAG